MEKLVQWYPGHMTKARRLMEQNVKLVDVVVELLDARIPESSRNPDIAPIVGNKPRIVVLNKSDLADKSATDRWKRKLASPGVSVVLELNANMGNGVKDLIEACRKAASVRLKVESNKGRLPRPVRIMIAGVPNVGKSSLINRMVQKSSTKVGNKPGVTRGQQWVRVREDVELLDTPGLLWPRFDDQKVGYNLALTGAVSLDVVDHDALARYLLFWLSSADPGALSKRYKDCPVIPAQAVIPEGTLDHTDANDGPLAHLYADEHTLALFAEAIGRSRGYLVSGGGVDWGKSVLTLLQDFRDGRLGRYTLD